VCPIVDQPTRTPLNLNYALDTSLLEKRKKMNAKQTEAEEYKTGKKMKLSII